jgi:hypothetical protein
LVAPGDTNAIAHHLRRLAIARDELENLQRAARAFAVKNLGAQAMYATYEQAFRALMADTDETPRL